MLIDGHVHLGPLPQGGRFWGDFNEYRKICEELKISRYCTQPIGVPENFTDNTTPNNSMVLSEANKDPKIIPVYWFNVFDLPEGIDKGYKAIKFHPDIGQIPINDRRVIDFVKRINLPVFVHTNENNEYSNLGSVGGLANKVDVPVIAIHSGSVTKTFFKLDQYKFPENTYFETSGIQYALILRKIYQRFGADRIIFGSDYPFGDPRVPLAMIEALDVTKSEHAKITRKNIETILQL